MCTEAAAASAVAAFCLLQPFLGIVLAMIHWHHVRHAQLSQTSMRYIPMSYRLIALLTPGDFSHMGLRGTAVVIIARR